MRKNHDFSKAKPNPYVTGQVFDGLQDFVEACKQIDDWRQIDDADWDEEIGALREVTGELIPDPPMLLFDNIKGYPAGFRVVGLLTASYKRAALALGLPVDEPRAKLSELASRKMREVEPIPPVEVTDGPVMQNVLTGDEVDLLRFPAPRYHAMDGGRYIGTGDCVINRDPESGFVNAGTYRMQVHDRDLLGLWMSPGQHGRQICQRHWEQGRACPVAATFGGDPLIFIASHNRIPWGRSELELAGGLRGRPAEVIPGPVTGLPIPAHAEIAVEGEVPPPDEESRDEGPFGEWPGYYSGGTIGTGEPQPVIRVKAVYYRNNPIIHGDAPMWPGARRGGLEMGTGRGGVADLARAGIQDVVGVGQAHGLHPRGGDPSTLSGARAAGGARRRGGHAQRPLDRHRRRGHRSHELRRGDVGHDHPRRAVQGHRGPGQLLEHAAGSADAAREARFRRPHQLAGGVLRGAPFPPARRLPQGQPQPPGAAREDDREVPGNLAVSGRLDGVLRVASLRSDERNHCVIAATPPVHRVSKPLQQPHPRVSKPFVLAYVAKSKDS